MSFFDGAASTSTEICRLCMENASCLVSVFAKLQDAFIAHVIIECTAVQVAENDGLPENICQACMTQLKHFVQFIQMARNTDRALRKRFKSEIELNQDGSAEPVEDEAKPQFALVLAVEEPVNTTDESKERRASEESDVCYDDANDSDWKDQDSNEEPKDTENKKSTVDEDITSMDELELENFVLVELDPDKLLCCSCLDQFDNQDDLKEHGQKTHTNDRRINTSKKFICHFCQRRYISAIALQSHKRKIETICKVFECKKCGMRVLEKPRRRVHTQCHVNKVPPKPKKTQPSLEELMDKVGRLCCALGCTESFETDDQLLAHSHSVHKANKVEAKLAYNEGKPAECPVCFKRFKDEECVKRHLRFKYKGSKNICTLCGAKFPSLASLTIHERSHTKEKPFECEICSKGFGDKQSLKRHYVKHTNEKPFMCSVCGVFFKRKRAMQSHMTIHEPGALPFKCEVCDRCFRVKAKLMYHMRTHTGERPYPCRYCDKSFADFSNRMRHELSHTGEKPYKCSYCPMGFITKRFMLVHEKTHKRNEVKQPAANIP